jgi:membrane-bound lytic murein transglycosylase D
LKIVKIMLPVTLVLIMLNGCSLINGLKTGNTDDIQSPEVKVAIINPIEIEDSINKVFCDTISFPDSPINALAERPDLQQLEELYRNSLKFLSSKQLDPVEEIIHLLAQESVNPEYCETDSIGILYLESLSRRVALLSGIVAEEQHLIASISEDDSLLSKAYKNLSGFSFPDSLIPITGTQRSGIEADLLYVDNPRVQKWIKHFTTGSGRLTMEKWLHRKTAVDSLISTHLDVAGLPAELIYHALIESGFNTSAKSRVGAVGPWQFMPATGKHFGLRVDWWVDERQDFEMSTIAAITYLTQLYNHFDDWALALAAYNAGEHRIDRAIKSAGHDDFWNLRLPWETQNHIPKFIAVARISENQNAYGFNVSTAPTFQYEVIQVTDATCLDLIASCAKVTEDELVVLNPALLRRATPPGNAEYPVKVPIGTGKRCMQKLRKIPFDKRLTWRKHIVKRGESLGLIAQLNGTSVREIIKLNKIRNKSLIHPGDKLLIPMPAQLAAISKKRSGEKGYYVPPANFKRVYYTVKRGDTLTGISKRLKVSLKHLRKVNNMQKGAVIRPGDRIYAYRPQAG